MYKECKSYADQARCVSSLVDRCTTVRERFGYSDQDARGLVLNNIRFIAYGCQMILNLLDSWANIGPNNLDFNRILGIKIARPKDYDVALNALSKNNKLTLVLLGQFQIENCLRSLARELKSKDTGQGFYLLASGLLASVGLNGQQRMDQLDVPALIRNSLHANGIHKGHQGKDTRVPIGVVEYEFVNGQSVHCATTEHIAHAVESSVNILAEVFATEKVAALPDPVMDEYVWDIATTP